MDSGGGIGGGPPPVAQDTTGNDMSDTSVVWLVLPVVLCFVLLAAALYLASA